MKDTFHTEHLVSDGLLRHLANPNYHDACGDFDEDTRAMLSTAVPEMAAELLRHREAASAQTGALMLAYSPEHSARKLREARAVLHAPGPVSNRDLAMACVAIKAHTKNAAEFAAAQDVLHQIEAGQS